MLKRILFSLMLAGLMLPSLTASAVAAPGGVTNADTLQELAQARQATQQYHRAELPKWDEAAGGYAQVSPRIAGMGYHYVNFGLLDGVFDVTAPEVLLYEDAGNGRRLVAVEYVVVGGAPEGFTGSEDVWVEHLASCHYTDGTEELCASDGDADPGKTLAMWHPDLWTLHVWLWQGNPDGIFAEINPNLL